MPVPYLTAELAAFIPVAALPVPRFTVFAPLTKSNWLFFIAPSENVPVLAGLINKFVPRLLTAPVDSKLKSIALFPVIKAFTGPVTAVPVIPSVYNPRESSPLSSNVRLFKVVWLSLAYIPTPSLPALIVPEAVNTVSLV